MPDEVVIRRETAAEERERLRIEAEARLQEQTDLVAQAVGFNAISAGPSFASIVDEVAEALQKNEKGKS